MNEKESGDLKNDKLSSRRLRGKQSVRATFRLPVQLIDLLHIAASQLGVQQKSLFDYLLEDRAVLRRIAGAGGEKGEPAMERHQKTVVLSRNSLALLNEMAREHSVARDILVEASIRRLIPVVRGEQRKQEKRKQLLAALVAHCGTGRRLLERAGELVGEEDPVWMELRRMTEGCSEALERVKGFVERGKCLEGIDLIRYPRLKEES